MNFDELMQTFVAESREVLQEMENGLLALETAPDPAETINAIFRAAHTIKGSAGLFELDRVVSFTHNVETVLDRVRKKELAMSPELATLLLGCCDHMKALIEEVAAGSVAEASALAALGAPLTAQLLGYAPLPASSPAPPRDTWKQDVAGAPRDGALGVGGDQWHISLRFGRNVLRNGMDPLSFIRYLGQLGTITGIVTLHDASGLDEDMDPESCFLGFEIALRSAADKTTIEGAFEFVRDDCRISILPPHSQISEYVRLIQDLPEGTTRLGELLTQCGSVTARELAAALETQAASAPGQRLGTILVQQGAVTPAVVDAALVRQAQFNDARSHATDSIG